MSAEAGAALGDGTQQTGEQREVAGREATGRRIGERRIREREATEREATEREATERRVANGRLIRLFLTSRQAPLAVAILAGCAVLLQICLRLHWVQGDGDGALAQQFPILIEAGAAVAIAVTARSPFGELERAAGRVLPRLRLGAAALLTALAAGALTIGARTPGGDTEILRNVAGLTGLGLLTATLLGGPLAWVGPTAYAMVAEFAITVPWTSPAMWPARPAHDLGANAAAGAVFAIGLAAFALRGARDSSRD